jgi:hypothetical protein
MMRVSTVVCATSAFFVLGCAGQGAGGGYTGPSPSRLCAEHMGKLAGSTMLYAGDYDDKLPSSSWMDSIAPYVTRFSLVCPAVENDALTDHGYAMNSILYGLPTNSIPDTYLTVFFFETALLGRNVVGDPAAGLKVSRHEGTIFNVRCDGSVLTKLP